MEISYSLYSNLKITVPFKVIVVCVITEIKPVFAPTSVKYYINEGDKEIDLSSVIYNQVPLCRLEQTSEFTITLGTAAPFTTLEMQGPKLKINTADAAKVSETSYDITVQNKVTIISNYQKEPVPAPTKEFTVSFTI